ncbi:MAG: hypothetical protein WCK53_00425 [Methanomicrobiales archaeon]
MQRSSFRYHTCKGFFASCGETTLHTPTSSCTTTPLVVISSGRNMSFMADPAEDAHANGVYRTLQREMAAESPGGRYLVADNSGHNIQIDQPDVVIDSIRSVVQDIRDHQSGNPGP